MHLADGTLANQVCTVTIVASSAALAGAAWHARGHVTPRNLLRAGVGAAIVFAAQAIDVPLFGAVPVHVVGAALLTLLAGPALAVLVMAAVLTVQALALGDGGISTLGANVFNMGVVGVGVAAVVMHVARTRVGGRAGLLVGVALAGAASIFAAVVAMGIELVLSGAGPDVVATAMTAHAPFAAFETVATVACVAAASSSRVLAREFSFDRVEK